MTRGYDNYRPNQMLVMDLQFRETTGTAVSDNAKTYRPPLAMTGTPAWAVLGNDLTYLSFNPANPDFILSLAADSTAQAGVPVIANGGRYVLALSLIAVPVVSLNWRSITSI